MTLVEEPQPQGKATVKKNRRGEPWDDAYERIRRERPSVASRPLLSDRAIWALVSDMAIFARRSPGTPVDSRATTNKRGPRAPVDLEEIKETVDIVFRRGCGVGASAFDDGDATALPFVEAFGALMGSRSLMQMSRRTDIPKHRLHRLLIGTYPPTGTEMEAIAGTFGKRPWYFLEYRSTMIAAMVLARMDQEPNRSAAIARELDNAS